MRPRRSSTFASPSGLGRTRSTRFNDHVEFRILGPLEIVDNREAIPLGSRRQRALLALLLLDAGEVVSRDRLIEELWLGKPPPSAETTLRAHLSRLRAAIGAERLESRALGYALVAEPDELDAHRFERLSAEGRAALAEGRYDRAAEVLRAALELWRGPALADFASQPFAQVAIARLEESRLLATEARIEAELALGLHAHLVGELAALVAEHPLRERLRGQLMLALYRSGRQAEALECFRDVRRVLTDELGLEPGAELAALQKAILSHDPALELPVPVEGGRKLAPQGSGTGALVGRAAELEQLLEALDDALEGRARLALISGEPGIGKTRLAEELARHARDRGAEVLVGRCWEAGGAPAFWPFVQALRTYVRAHDRTTVRQLLGSGSAELAQLLPELAEVVPTPPPASAVEPETARFRLFDAVASFLRAAAAAGPIVLVLDDLHAADEPSLLLLRFVAGALADSALLVVGIYRNVDPGLTDPLSSTLAELSREPVTRRLTLAGLGQEDVASFIEHTSGRDPSEQVTGVIHRVTEGNPLFVGEIVRLLVTEGALDEVGSDATRPFAIPDGVRAVIDRRLRHLTDGCKDALVLGSVLGRDFSIDALTRASGSSRETLLGLLDEAVGERVVTEPARTPGRLRFGHVLIRDVLYDELPPGRRAQLHGRVGEALESLYEDDLATHLAELAHHFLAAAPAGNADTAAHYARRAGDQAAAQLAYEEAVRLYELALPHVRDDRQRCDLLLALGDARARSGVTATAKDAYRRAAELAERLGLPEGLARAALGYGGRFLWDASRDDPDLVPLLERALAALPAGHDRLRVRLLARLAAGPLRDATFDPERRVALSAQALKIARDLGDPGTLAYALAGRMLADDSPDKTRERLELATELLELTDPTSEKERAVEALEVRLLSLLETGEIEAARAELARMADLAAELRQPSQQWFVAAYRALLALLEGRLDEAEQLVPEAHALGSRVQPWSAEVSYRLQLYVLRREQGRLEEVRELVASSVDEFPTYPVWRCVFVATNALLGREDEARDALEALAEDDFAALRPDEGWLVGVSLLSEAVRLLRDERRAQLLHDRLLPYADRVGVIYTEISTGAVARHLGLLASTAAAWSAAERHFARALEVNRRIGARPQLAHTQHDFADMLLERRAAGDVRKARRALEAALAGYRGLAAEPHAAIVEARLDSLRGT